MKNVGFINKSVLDIGTGYFGFLAEHTKLFGAKRVVAIDLNSDAIEYASSLSKQKIEYRVGDVYSSIKPDEKFDIIISNPPQLPSIFGGKIHDIADENGMSIIKKIINGFRYYTNENGEIYLLAFDFLFNEILRVCKNNELDATVIAYYNKYLRKGGETEKRKDFIENLFRDYKFQKDEKGFYHRVYIINIRK